ncbi:MAG: hypothetical protein ACKOFF_07260 [Acidimicrobiales bacterium]
MKKNKRRLRIAAAAVAAGALGALAPAVTNAAVPTMMQDDGAYVRLLGSPADGTAKFQFGWSASTPASAAAGYWVGLYDVTNSHYEWAYDTGAVDLPDEFFRNARPTADLPNGNYKVVFFVRAGYGPATNISEIEFPFTVTNSMM